MTSLFHKLASLVLLLVSPVVAVVSLLGLWLADLLWLISGRRTPAVDTPPNRTSASVVIPNWNGKDLLEKYLPSVLEAMAGDPMNEVIVVDNGSTDGSAEFIRATFPDVKLIALSQNLGFGGGSNTGFKEARNDIVVLLNSDMRVAPDFLQPLLDGFTDEKVFAVSCQIFFSDPAKRREETGLTQAWWQGGSLRARHRDDDAIQDLYPCFYGGGGSCAFDRRKFLELGGFDELLRPFYLEDTDLGYLAWKRGWKVLYQPKSHVWHEHRGTIGKNFSRSYIDNIIRKNRLLFCWKNIHEPSKLLEHFVYTWTGAVASLFAGESHERASLRALWRAFLQLSDALEARQRARSLAVVSDSEAFLRPMAGYFRDRFIAAQQPAHPRLPAQPRLNVLFVAPYAIEPPMHGGALFMNETVRYLGQHVHLHLIAMVDAPKEIPPHERLAGCTASMLFRVRQGGHRAESATITPYAVREFHSDEFEWMIHRQIYQQQIDVVQVEYTQMAQYGGPYRHIAWVLFEHDIYFQSIGRSIAAGDTANRWKASFEYLRALRFELNVLPLFDRIQTCTPENKAYLASFVPELKDRMDDHVRAGIDVERFPFTSTGRVAHTMLFLGSFRHPPNRAAMEWFLDNVMPLVLQECPDARLKIIGSGAPPNHMLPLYNGAVELAGYVEDLRQPMAEAAVFICPILSGSGVRVKLLEAFAAGIPVVSTRVGAEGLTRGEDGDVCAVGDTPQEFAQRILQFFARPEDAAAMAWRARRHVEAHHHMPALAKQLEQTYRLALQTKAARSAS